MTHALLFSSTEIGRIQAEIDATIRFLGGYWPPLSGLARVLEELGEVSEMIAARETDPEEMAGELADLYIISSCLANQYCIDLAEEYNKAGLPDTVEDLYIALPQVAEIERCVLDLIAQGGQVARILNHYEGGKKKKKAERSQTLAAEIVRFQFQVMVLAKTRNIQVLKHVEQVLNKNRQRDRARFSVTPDPSTEDSRLRFIVSHQEQNVDPPLISSFKIWGASPWQQTETGSFEHEVEFNLERNREMIERFASCASDEQLEGFVFEVPASYPEAELREQMKRWFISNFASAETTAVADLTETVLISGLSLEILTLRTDDTLFYLFRFNRD